jgi:hypothetical protein
MKTYYLAFLLLAAAACTPQQGVQAQNAIAPGVAFAICIITTYTKEAAGVPMTQVIADEITACGGDAATIVPLLDAHEAKGMHLHVAHEKPISFFNSAPTYQVQIASYSAIQPLAPSSRTPPGTTQRSTAGGGAL